MKICIDANAMIIAAPAKINLFLEVLGKRADDYHELDTVMSAISLCDELHFEATDSGEIRINVETPSEREGHERNENEFSNPNFTRWSVPANSDNLVYRAAAQTIETMRENGYSLPTKKCGLFVKLKKRIPAQSGLGGGSSDAAAAIVATMALLFKKYDANLAHRIASNLGSDLNFFLADHSGDSWFGRCSGRGEIVQNIDSNVEIRGIVAQPAVGCSTGEIFSALSISKEIRNAATLTAAIQDANITQLLQTVFNRLEKPVCSIASEFQQTLSTIATMATAVQLPVFMTGSGSAMVVLDASVRSTEICRPNDAGDNTQIRQRQRGEIEFLTEQIRNRFDDHFVEPFVGWQCDSIEDQLAAIDVAICNGSRTEI